MASLKSDAKTQDKARQEPEALRRAPQCGASLRVGSACPRVTGHKPRVTGPAAAEAPSPTHDAKRTTHHDPRVTGHESQATASAPRVTGHEPRSTPRLPRATSPDAQRRSAPREGRATTCSHCVYARRPTGLWLRLILSRWMGLLFCTNHPDYPGDMIGVPPCGRCRNFRPRPLPVERPDVPDQAGRLVCTIPLTQKKVALVDAIDYERVNQFKWCANRIGHQWYAQRRTDGRTIRMHRFIMAPPKGMVVDHANGNGLDNRRDNLRVCTKLENAWNKRRRKRPGTRSPYIGVYPCRRPPGKWCIKVQRAGEVTNVSPFDTPEEAARVRDRKALELFGEYAMLNFPEEREQRLREIEAEKAKVARRREEPS